MHIPLEPHSYFRAVNRDSEKVIFLKSNTYEPNFRYGKILSGDYIESRKNYFSNDAKGLNNLNLLNVSIELNRGKITPEEYIEASKRIYTEPDNGLVNIIFNRYLDLCKVFNESNDFVTDNVSISKSPNISIGPSVAKFKLLREYMNLFLKDKPMIIHGNLADSIDMTLRSTGLSSEGWKLIVDNTDRHARVNHKTKSVKLGSFYRGRSVKFKNYIVAHEIYGHAMRGFRSSIYDSEGFAIMLEQLMDKKFKFKRTYRYLAIALGMGFGGKPRSFREVFEIMWRVMAVMSYRVNESRARSFAFDECYRAFRGSNGRVAGAVYLKDSVYFHANIMAWETIENRHFSYSDFLDTITGRKSII
ncbi:MAG: hypothetical protein WAS94_02210 [Candidatus Saccharimonadales bacterium]